MFDFDNKWNVQDRPSKWKCLVGQAIICIWDDELREARRWKAFDVEKLWAEQIAQT